MGEQTIRDLVAIGIAVISGLTAMQIVNVAKAESETIREEDEDE